MLYFFKNSVLTTIAVSIILLTASTAFAQTPEGVQIKPAVIEDRVNPGDTYSFTLQVTNIAEVERTFFLVAQDIKLLDDRGQPVFVEPGEPTGYELSSWVKMPQESVTLGAGETRDVPFTIQVPANASPGSHFGGVFMDSRAPRLRASGAGIGVMVGSVISLRIAGDVTEDARLREFSTQALVYNEANVEFTALVENLGNVLIRPQGFLEITDMWGSKVGQVRVNESGAAIFPFAERSYITQWEDDGFAFGRYQVVLSLTYGDDARKTVAGTLSFWVLPLKPILTVLGALIGGVLLMYLFVRVYIQRKLKEMGVRSGGEYYARKYQRTTSRASIVMIAIFMFALIFLAILFMMFA